MTRNQSVLTSLPAASTGHVEASLLVQDPPIEVAKGKEGEQQAEQSGGVDAGALNTWNFLINPSALNYSRKANYTPSGTLNSTAAVMQYFNTDGTILSMDNVLMDSWHDGKSLRPLLEGLERLLEAQVNQGKFAPPVLSFVWGSKRFGPCVLLDVSWDEAAWLSGEPALATVNMKLQALPPEIERSENPLNKPELLNTDDNMTPDEGAEGAEPRMPLTDSQIASVKEMAATYLVENQQLWNFEIQREIEVLGSDLKNYFSVDPDTGIATFYGIGLGGVGYPVLQSNGDFSDASGVVDVSLSSAIADTSTTAASRIPTDITPADLLPSE